MKTVTLKVIQNNTDIYSYIKEKLIAEYLNSFMTLNEFSTKYDIVISAIKFILNKENLVKDLKKYNAMHQPGMVDKINKTKIEHYGSLEEANRISAEKNKKTRLEHFNGKYFSEQGFKNLNTPEAEQKRKESYKKTCLEKYGVENIFQNSAYIQQKFSEKYGENIINPGQVPEIRQKVINTNQLRYGVSCTFQAEEVKEKIKQTNLTRYGVENANQNEYIKAKSRLTRINNGNQWCKGEEVEDFLKQWDFTRKPTFTDFAQYLNKNGHNIQLTNAIKIIYGQGFEEQFSKRVSYLESVVEDFLISNDLQYEKHNRDIISPLEVDFYLPQYNLALEIDDIWSHNSSIGVFNKPPKSIDYHFNKTNLCEEKGVRLIHLYEPHILNEHKWQVLKDIILHACFKSKKIAAKKLDLVIDKAINFKQFFEENNINGYRKADTAFMLVDKKTREPIMGYSIGDAYLGKGKYDAEVARGACKLGYSVVGGASRLWKNIIQYYETHDLKNRDGKVNSIVYYVDRNYYNGKSMQFLDNVQTLKNQYGFFNYFIDTKELKNRNPAEHEQIKQLEKEGKVLVIGNSGTQVNVWYRNTDKIV